MNSKPTSPVPEKTITALFQSLPTGHTVKGRFNGGSINIGRIKQRGK